jgi:long-chain fatty acid transport protein
MMHRILKISVACLVFFFAPNLSAAGFFLPGRGVEPMGRAGAFIASGEADLNTLWYNPANIASIDRNKGLADLSVINLEYSFHRAPRQARNGETIRYDRVESRAAPQPIPQLAVGGPTSNDKLSWAAGFYGPYNSGVRFPQSGPQRYMVVNNEGSLMAFLHAAVGYQVSEDFRVGVGIQNAFGRFRIINATSSYRVLYGGPEVPEEDELNQVILESLLNPTGNAGLWYRFNEHLQGGASYQLPVTFHDDNATIKTRFPTDPLHINAELTNNTLSGDVKLPGILRAGLRLTRPNFDLELAGVYERWSRFKRIYLEPNSVQIRNIPGIGSIPVEPLSIPMQFQDSYSLRLGGTYHIAEDWDLRAGYGFETPATTDEYHSLIVADNNKHIFSGGVGWRFSEAFSFDFSAAWYALGTRRIRNSKLRQIKPIDVEKELRTVIGNGDYTANFFVAGFGVNYNF